MSDNTESCNWNLNGCLPDDNLLSHSWRWGSQLGGTQKKIDKTVEVDERPIEPPKPQEPLGTLNLSDTSSGTYALVNNAPGLCNITATTYNPNGIQFIRIRPSNEGDEFTEQDRITLRDADGEIAIGHSPSIPMENVAISTFIHPGVFSANHGYYSIARLHRINLSPRTNPSPVIGTIFSTIPFDLSQGIST